jgi:hypothetical protein
MKALERPGYIEAAKLEAVRLNEQGRVRKQIKNNFQLKKFWNLGHGAVVPKSFPNRDCEIAYQLGRQNAEADWMDE